MYSPDRSKAVEPARVLSAISKSGLKIDDINGAIEGDFGRAEIGEQLADRAGPVFVRLTHLGHIYSLPPQYSKSACYVGSQELIIEVSTWYRLTFVREDEKYRLNRVEYLEVEGG